jgi:predicted nucleotidyltransferase
MSQTVPSDMSIDEAIRHAVSDLDGIVLLILFGSRATGKARPASDIDLAVLASPDDAHTKRRLLSRLASAVAHLTPAGRADVVFLDETPELLRHSIMRDGHLILCRDDALWRSWRVRTMREHGDREWYRRILRKGLKRRLLAGGEKHGRSGHVVQSLERTGLLSD